MQHQWLGEQLQSPENIFAVVATESALPLERAGLAALHRLATTAPRAAWDAAVRTWRQAQAVRRPHSQKAMRLAWRGAHFQSEMRVFGGGWRGCAGEPAPDIL